MAGGGLGLGVEDAQGGIGGVSGVAGVGLGEVVHIGNGTATQCGPRAAGLAHMVGFGLGQALATVQEIAWVADGQATIVAAG